MSASRAMTWVRFARNCLTLLLCATVLGNSDGAIESRLHRVLGDLYDARDFAGGRLAGFPYRSRGGDSVQTAQIEWLLDRDSDPISTRRFQGLFLAFNGRLNDAENIFTQLALDLPKDAAIQNDLGVIQMAGSAANPLALFTAIQQFKLALAAEPNFPEAKYNLILAYRHLRVARLQAAAERAYRGSVPPSAWDAALLQSAAVPMDVESLSARVAASGPEEISTLVQAYPEYSRKIVLDYAFRASGPVPPNYLHIAQELAERYGDHTAMSALKPLGTNEEATIKLVRKSVQEGRDLYLRARLRESQNAYARAIEYAKQTSSVFDRLWVEVNYADTLTRMAEYPRATATLRHVSDISRANKFKWLLARALSILGSSPALSDGFMQATSALDEAVEIYRMIGETRESARPLYYQAAYNHIAGSFERSLHGALVSLNAADPSDHIRLTQLYALISVTLSRMGYSELAAEFHEEASDHAQKAANPDLTASMKIQLASLYLLSNRTIDALAQIKSARAAIEEISSEAARNFRSVSLNLTAARIRIASGDLVRAEEMLRSNTEALPGNPAASRTNHVRSQSLLLLSKVLGAQGRMEEAGQELRNAVNLAENDQDYFSNMDLQVAFDVERRQLYEAAVEFEFKSHGCEESWKLLQGYKAKLFLELLSKISPTILPVGRTMEVADIKRRLPNDVQIADYIVLQDRVVVWIISKETFECRAIPIKRYQLERNVSIFLKQLRERQGLDQVSQELFAILGEPILDLLDSRRVLVIIPDGILHRLPFSALRSNADGRYWIERMPIMESPSIGYFFSARNIPSSTARRYIAFGPRAHDVVIDYELKNLQRIYTDMKIRTGSEVTRAAFLQAMSENDILYYAGHSAFDVRAPLQSSILLDGDTYGSNTVSALDILAQRAPANGIVMLSSCDTALGNSTDGPGIRGLTSAFLVAGAGAVVGTIWPVESASTAQLMSLTFEHLIKHHMTIAGSLQAAQIQLLRSSSPHPYYWAGFVVTGHLNALGKRQASLPPTAPH